MTVSPQQIKTEEQIKEEHLKRLEQLAISHIGDIPQLEEPTYDQKQWLQFRLTHSSTWPKYENKIGDYKNWK